MKIYGRAAISEFLGEHILYRNLVPSADFIKPINAIRDEIGLPEGMIPRKSEAEYAQVVAHFLWQAQSQRIAGKDIRRLVFIGDTRLLDGTAFSNLCSAGGWPGLAFICSETRTDPKVEIIPVANGQSLFLSNRWAALDSVGSERSKIQSFPSYCEAHGFPIDEQTALIIDLDKTAIGARGRNASVIDEARVQAVHDTIENMLGTTFNSTAFRMVYDQLNQPEFHSFTEDNQDYLAYTCLILGSGLFEVESLMSSIHAGQLISFHQFIQQVGENKNSLPIGLQPIHDDIYTNVLAGDPTPFKAFRYREYQTTIGRMGYLPDTSKVERLLAEEIVITQEVRALALAWQSRGALAFGLSDKPDEASTPTEELKQQGYVPLHRKVTHIVGE